MSSRPAPRSAAVVLAGGSGRRLGGEVNKVLLPLAGRPVLEWSLLAVRAVPGIVRTVVVVRPEDEDVVRRLVADELVVHGGLERQHSEWSALQALGPLIDAGGIDVVAIHDGARPLAGIDLWSAVIQTAADHGGAVPTRAREAVVHVDGSAATDLVGVQTPQAFRAAPLWAAYRDAERDGFIGTDTAACLERYSRRGDALRVVAVPAPATNLKITFLEDLALAERLHLAPGT